MLSAEAYFDKFQLEKKSADEALLNRPPSTATQLDAHERACVQHYEDELTQARQKTEAEIGRLQSERVQLADRIHVDQVRMDLNNVVNNLRPSRAKLWGTAKAEIQRSRESFELAIRRLRRFQFDHGVSAHKADYPDSTIHHFALIAAIAVAEWLSLSSFYAEGSDFGLVGGVMYALAFSIINLGLAIGLGYFFRYINHRAMGFKAMAIAIALFAGGVFVAISLLAAHYRDVTEQIAQQRAAAEAAAANDSRGGATSPPPAQDSLAASSVAVEHLLSHPWGLRQTWSWVLFAAAIVFGLLAAYKGYKSDDRYPGYGKVDRQYKQAELEYEAVKERHRTEFDAFYRNQSASVDDAFKKVTLDVRGYDRSIDTAKGLVTEFERTVQQALSQCQTAIRRYRHTNAQLRTDSAPAYFALDVGFGGHAVQLPIAVKPQEEGLRQQFSLALTECRDQHDEVAKRISDEHAAALEEFDREVRALEQWVAQHVASQNPALTSA